MYVVRPGTVATNNTNKFTQNMLFTDTPRTLSSACGQGNFETQVDERPEMYLMGDELQAHLEAHA